MQDTLAKKIFAVGSAVAMTMSLAMPFAAQAAAHGAGTNVSDSSGTIWMITANGTRRAYTSAGAFLSYGFNSWSTVVPASSDDLALPVDSAGFIPPQDGKIFCATATKGSDVKGECSLITGGQKAAFTSAAVFTGLGFSFSRAQYGDSSFLTKTANIDNSTSAHLPGVLVNNNGTVQLVGSNGLLGIPDLATFNSWGYSFADVVPANAADKAMTQTGVMAMRQPGQLSPTALASTGGSTGGSVVSGNVTASLSSDTPAAGTLVSSSVSSSGSQVGADIAHFTFSGSGTVTQVIVKRVGVSADTSINNVYLYQGNNRITDAGSFSNGQVTFSNSNGLFTVSGTATISVRVDVGTNISGQSIGAQLASYTVANGTPASTSISGNLFNIAAVSDVATVKLSNNSNTSSITGSGANDGTNGTINAGTSNANLWGTTVTVGQRAVKLSYIQFKQIGSVSSDAIQNLKLMVDGSQVGSTASVSSMGTNTNVVVFDLTGSPVTLNTGSHTIELHGDIVKGTSYTYEFTLQTESDALFQDTSYSVYVPLTHNDGTQILQLNPGTTTINSGTVTVQQDPSFTATQFVKNASQVTLGQWTMKAYGEDVKVQNLKVALNYFLSDATTAVTPSSTDGFNNLAVYVNGSQVGSSLSAISPSSATPSYTFGTTNLFTIPAGQTVTVAVKGDSVVGSGDSWADIRTDLVTPQNSLQGATSFSLTPSGDTTYTGTHLSVSSSNATLALNTGYANQTISPNTTKQKIGSFVIQASNADGVRVNSLTVTFTAGSNNTANPTTTLANLYLVTPDFPNGTTPVAPSASTNFSTNFTVAANQTATVDVYADVSNTTGTIQAALKGSGIGSTSSQTVTLSSQNGQVITVGTGTVATPTLQTSSPVASFVVPTSGTNYAPAATFNFTSTGGGATIQELDFDTTNSSGSAVSITSVTVGGVTAPMVNASSSVSGLSIAVPTTYAGVDVPVTVGFAPVGNNGVPGNQQFVLNLIRVKYLSGSTTKYLPTGGTTYAVQAHSNTFDLVGSYPTVTLTSAGNAMSAGNITVGSITVSANAGGNVTLTQVPFTVASTTGVTADTISLVDASTGVTAAPAATIVNNATSVPVTTDNSIAAGTSKTYNIVVHVTSTGSANTPSLSVSLGAATAFTFNDINGNASLVGQVGSNTFIPNYPTNSAIAK